MLGAVGQIAEPVISVIAVIVGFSALGISYWRALTRILKHLLVKPSPGSLWKLTPQESMSGKR